MCIGLDAVKQFEHFFLNDCVHALHIDVDVIDDALQCSEEVSGKIFHFVHGDVGCGEHDGRLEVIRLVEVDVLFYKRMRYDPSRTPISFFTCTEGILNFNKLLLEDRHWRVSQIHVEYFQSFDL